jgi:predicted nucleic acid-binding protein
VVTSEKISNCARGKISSGDAIHVASMEDGGLRFILSTDENFDAFGTVERIDPTRFPR